LAGTKLYSLVTGAQQQQYLFASKGGLPEEHQLNNAGQP